MNCKNFKELVKHVGHEIHCVSYNDENVAILCKTCNFTILDFNKFNQECKGLDRKEQLKQIFKKILTEVYFDSYGGLPDNAPIKEEEIYIEDKADELISKVEGYQGEKECEGYDGVTGWRDEG